MKVRVRKKKNHKTKTKPKKKFERAGTNEDFNSQQAITCHNQTHSFSKIQFSHLEHELIITYPVIFFYSWQEEKNINNKTPNCKL